MNREEFEQRTGYFPSTAEYEVIEEFYLEHLGDKESFCMAYRNNERHLAQKIQAEINRRYYEQLTKMEKESKEQLNQIERLKAQLEKELEWKPYEDSNNVTQPEYEHLADAGGTRELSEYEAKDILYQWFGFAKEAVTIIRTVPVYEVNRHRCLRQIGEADRKPLYNASDWHYIRFDCGQMCWELFNDSLRPFSH